MGKKDEGSVLSFKKKKKKIGEAGDHVHSDEKDPPIRDEKLKDRGNDA